MGFNRGRRDDRRTRARAWAQSYRKTDAPDPAFDEESGASRDSFGQPDGAQLAHARPMEAIPWILAAVIIGAVIAYTLKRKRQAHE